MTTKSKKYQIRKDEILNAAQNLFFAKGYSETTINDILDSVKIAKGTFYHYFESKEEIMDSIIMRFIEQNADVVERIANDPSLSAIEKLRAINATNYTDIKQKEVLDRMQKTKSDGKYLAGMIETTLKYTPIFTKVIEQGIKEGTFKNPYPKETMEFLMVLNQFIFSGELLPCTRKQFISKAKALAHLLESSLHAKPGTFDYLYRKYE